MDVSLLSIPGVLFSYSYLILASYWMMSYDCFFWNTWKIGEKRKKLEEEKGIIIRFVIGHR